MGEGEERGFSSFKASRDAHAVVAGEEGGTLPEVGASDVVQSARDGGGRAM